MLQEAAGSGQIRMVRVMVGEKMYLYIFDPPAQVLDITQALGERGVITIKNTLPPSPEGSPPHHHRNVLGAPDTPS